MRKMILGLCEWLEAMQNNIIDEERRIIESIFEDASMACPIYSLAEEVEIDC